MSCDEANNGPMYCNENYGTEHENDDAADNVQINDSTNDENSNIPNDQIDYVMEEIVQNDAAEFQNGSGVEENDEADTNYSPPEKKARHDMNELHANDNFKNVGKFVLQEIDSSHNIMDEVPKLNVNDNDPKGKILEADSICSTQKEFCYIKLENGRFGCTDCMSDYQYLASLRQHFLKKHDGDNQISYQCQICGKVYQHEHSLQRHSRIHPRQEIGYFNKMNNATPQMQHAASATIQRSAPRGVADTVGYGRPSTMTESPVASTRPITPSQTQRGGSSSTQRFAPREAVHTVRYGRPSTMTESPVASTRPITPSQTQRGGSSSTQRFAARGAVHTVRYGRPSQMVRVRGGHSRQTVARSESTSYDEST